MKIIDSHCHIWGREFLPPSFFRRAAEGWAQKVPGRTEDMIIPKLLDGVVDETGDDFVKNMDTAGVTAAFVMMVDAGTPLFGMEPATTIDLQVEYYATLQEGACLRTLPSIIAAPPACQLSAVLCGTSASLVSAKLRPRDLLLIMTHSVP